MKDSREGPSLAKQTSKRSKNVWRRLLKIVIVAFLIAFALYMILPFIWMISASFKSEKDVMSIPIQWIPKTFRLDNYKRVLNIGTKATTNYHFLLAYKNSIKVSVVSTFFSVASATLAGYAFAKLNFKGSKVLFIIYLAQMMVPTQLTLIPRFLFFSELRLNNTHLSLILPKIVSVSSTFLIRQAYISAPTELREAARIDGAGEFRIWWKIMTPLIKPTLAAVATVDFLNSWNSYLDPLVFLSDWKKRTLPLALNQFIGTEVTQYNLIMAACCLTVLPVFVVFLCGQRFFMKGLTVGAVKG
jgi:multiple sugar transport system permease protein